MSIEQLRNTLPDYAKDIKINLANLFINEEVDGLSIKQRFGVALAVAYTLKNKDLIGAILVDAENILTIADINAAKSAATIMAMNNIYYRFTHLVSDKSFAQLPAKLRMSVIGNPGIDKIDFELNCLAVSTINGCGMCMDAHTKELLKAGVQQVAIQSAVRIASVLNATAVSADIASH